MNDLNLISLLIIGVLVTDAHGRNCLQVVSGPEVDFKRVFDAAPWFVTYTMTKEFVNANNTPPNIDCFIITGGRVLTDKIEIDLHIYNNGSEIDSHFNIRHNHTGVYEFSKKSEVDILNDQLILEGSEKRIHQKDLAIGGKRTLILTDYVNYLVYITCSTESDWVIYMYTPTPFATTDQLNLVRNKLAEHGICAQIFLGNCNELAMKGLLK